MEGISDVSQCCRNLRWMVRQGCQDPSQWAVELNKLTRTYLGFNRAYGLLAGVDAKPDEIRMLSEIFKVEPEELVTVPLYSRDGSVFQLNLAYLIESIPHGQKDKVA